MNETIVNVSGPKDVPEEGLLPDDVSLSSMQPIISDDDQGENKDNDENQKELNDTDLQEEQPDPVLERYLVACQKGDLATVKELIESGLVDINEDHDKIEEVTGLHWASINNRLSVVAYLVSRGADINAKAGTLHAPPLHWAARYGYVYIVDYLLKHGADPTLQDDQGFNLLHLSVNSSNIMLVLYVLFFVVSKGILDVDCQDPNGRTPLLWAAYQGDSLTVDSLLKLGAYIKIPDNGGFTPLHWGTLKGQPHVLMYLIQGGGDFFQKTNDGKDCFTIAQDMNTVFSLNEALKHSGFDSRGYPLKRYFSKSSHAKAVTFFTPWVFLGVAFYLFSHIHPLFALPSALILGIAVNKILNHFVLPSYETVGVTPLSLLRTPLYAGLFSGSVFWLLFVWLTKIIPKTIIEEFWSNLFLISTLSSITYLLMRLLRSDPGRVPAEKDHEKVRATISELLSIGKFDTRHFCIETWVRKPLRSRFSSLSSSLVARFDHYCPWIYNDVGVKNHKMFIFFIIAIEAAIWTFACLCMEYFDELEDNNEEYKGEIKCFLLSNDNLCAGLTYDLFTSLILLWVIFQSIWVGFLIIVQLFQILKGVTNYEFSKLMKENSRMSLDPIMVNEFFNTAPEELAVINGDVDNVDELSTVNAPRRPGSHLKKSRKCFDTCCAVTGMDQWFMVMREAFGISRSSSGPSESLKPSFPTNYGWRTNWKDFWLTSDTTAPIWQRIFFSSVTSKALLGGVEVDYYKLYKLPPKTGAEALQSNV